MNIESPRQRHEDVEEYIANQEHNLEEWRKRLDAKLEGLRDRPEAIKQVLVAVEALQYQSRETRVRAEAREFRQDAVDSVHEQANRIEAEHSRLKVAAANAIRELEAFEQSEMK